MEHAFLNVVVSLFQQKIASEHQHSHESGIETGTGSDTTAFRGRQEAAHPGRHRTHNEDAQSTQAPTTIGRSAQPVVCKIQTKGPHHQGTRCFPTVFRVIC